MKVQRTTLINCGVSKDTDFRWHNLQQQMENDIKKNAEVEGSI